MQGLGLKDHRKLERFSIEVQDRSSLRSFHRAKDFLEPYFHPQTQSITVNYQLGAPQLISLKLCFPRRERPFVELETASPLVHKALPKIADELTGIIDMYRNRHHLLHNIVMQGLVMLSVPMLFFAYGYLTGIDPFFIFTSMGWLCLLSWGTTMTLPRLFPEVSFATRRRFHFCRLPVLGMFAFLLVVTACYISLVMFELPRAGLSPSVLLVSLG
jgi:hypothetical protein